MKSQAFENPTSPKGRCLTFWYYITGNKAGYLEWSIKNLKTNETIKIWKYGGSDYGREWNYGSFGFYIEDPYISIVTAVSGGSRGSIGIDDIIYKESQYCSVQPHEANVGNSLPLPLLTTKTPTSTSTPSKYDCNFESDYCNWKNDYSRPLNWTRNQGSTPNGDSGPSIDHT